MVADAPFLWRLTVAAVRSQALEGPLPQQAPAMQRPHAIHARVIHLVRHLAVLGVVALVVVQGYQRATFDHLPARPQRGSIAAPGQTKKLAKGVTVNEQGVMRIAVV